MKPSFCPHRREETGRTPRAMLGTGRRQAGWTLLAERNFGFLFSGQVISQIGDSLNRVALLWFVYELTGSAMKMTVVGLLQTIPPLIFGPLIGVYLDRLSKKAVMIGVDLVRTVMILLIPVLYVIDALTLGRLYILVFATSIVSTIFGPALASAIPMIVERTQLTAANALIQSTWHIGLLLGPAVSGVGIAVIGAQNVLYVDAASFLISAFCLMPIRVGGGLRARTETTRGYAAFVRDLVEGFRYVFVQQRRIARLMIITSLYSLGVSGFVFLLPVFAKECLGVGPMVLGGLWSALGAGMLMSSLALAAIQQERLRDRLRIVAYALGLGGLAICALGLINAPAPASLAILVYGASAGLMHPIMWAALQELTPTHLLGRVFTTFSTGAMSSAMAGMAGIGWVADAVGPEAGLMGIGLILLGTSAVAAFIMRGWGGHDVTVAGSAEADDMEAVPRQEPANTRDARRAHEGPFLPRKAIPVGSQDRAMCGASL